MAPRRPPRRRKEAVPAAPPEAAGGGEWAWGLLLLAMTLAAYATALAGGYIWDDPDYLTENPLIENLEGLRRIWFTAQTPQYYPLVFTSFWVEHKLWGLHPLGYHLVNVLLHAANALLAWRILGALGIPGAWLAGALFALHPVHAESVAWIAERKNVLSGLFYLLALRQYLVFEASRRAGRYAGALLLFLCALLSKSVAASLPAAALILLWHGGARIGAPLVLRLLPFFIAGASSGLFTAWLEVRHVGAEGPEWDLDPLQRLLLAGRILWFYLYKLLWPAELVFTYPRWTIDPGNPLHHAALLGVLIVALALWRWRGRLGRGPAAAALFYAVTLAPVLGFLNVYPMRFSFVADHFQYLASLGPIALAAGALARAWEAWGGRGAPGRAAAGALLVLLALLTLRQGRIYRDEETLWRDTLAKNPQSWMAHNNLGSLLARRGEAGEAIRHYEAALLHRPGHPNALSNMGAALLRLGRLAEAEGYLRRALAADPAHPGARNNLGRVLIQGGRLAEAVVELEEALRLAPGLAAARNNLGMARMRMGEIERAAREFARALEANPRLPEAHYNLGFALAQLRRYREAIAALREGLRRHPGDRPTAHLLAWLLATAPRPEWRDGEEALRLARRALEGEERDPVALNSLAAALAELGRFEEATRAAREALRLAEEAGLAEEAAQIRGLLQLYERGEPYRAP